MSKIVAINEGSIHKQNALGAQSSKGEISSRPCKVSSRQHAATYFCCQLIELFFTIMAITYALSFDFSKSRDFDDASQMHLQ
jgi:hypothetical protein